MRTPAFLFALALLGSHSWAQQQDEDSPWYLRAGLGSVSAEQAGGLPPAAGGAIDFDTGYALSAVLGRELIQGERFDLAVELEGYYEAFSVDDNDLLSIPSAVSDDANSFSVLINGMTRWHFTSQVAAYGGLGLGYSRRIRYDAWDSGGLVQLDTDGLVYQGRLGLEYALGGGYSFQLGYRYFRHEELSFEDQNTSETFTIDPARHVFEAGVRWDL